MSTTAQPPDTRGNHRPNDPLGTWAALHENEPCSECSAAAGRVADLMEALRSSLKGATKPAKKRRAGDRVFDIAAQLRAENNRLRGVIAEIERKLDGCISDHPEMPLSQAMAHVFLDIRAIIERECSGASSPQA